MIAIKAYTDLSQSKKLAEILSFETADMYYEYTKEEYKVHVGSNIAITHNLFSYRNGYTVPCWSLAALLSILPKPKIYYSTDKTNRWSCECWDKNGDYIGITKSDNPIDACYKMIIRLHK